MRDTDPLGLRQHGGIEGCWPGTTRLGARQQCPALALLIAVSLAARAAPRTVWGPGRPLPPLWSASPLAASLTVPGAAGGKSGGSVLASDRGSVLTSAEGHCLSPLTRAARDDALDALTGWLSSPPPLRPAVGGSQPAKWLSSPPPVGRVVGGASILRSRASEDRLHGQARRHIWPSSITFEALSRF